METSIAASTLLGTSIQALYAWMGYNRDSFAMNVGWRQAQQYQERNYQINWVSLARDDIRDLMGVSVHHAANALMVSTLLLSVTAVTFVCAGFSPTVPTFILIGFYASAGTAVIFLMVAIMFGVKSQDTAYEMTMQLLAYRLRPLSMAKHDHDYMKQAQEVEKAGVVRNLFRLPGMEPAYAKDAEKDSNKGKKLGFKSEEPHSKHSHHPTGRSHSAPPHTRKPPGSKTHGAVVEELNKNETFGAHLAKFESLERVWKPHEESSKLSTGLGVTCLAQASVYFALGKLMGRGEPGSAEAFLACVVVIVFIFVELMTFRNYRRGPASIRLVLAILLASGSICSSVAAALGDPKAETGLVPAAFICHLLFWFVACMALTFIPTQHGHGGHAAGTQGHGHENGHHPRDGAVEHSNSTVHSVPAVHGHGGHGGGHGGHGGHGGDGGHGGHGGHGHGDHGGHGGHDGHSHGAEGHGGHGGHGHSHGHGGADAGMLQMGSEDSHEIERRAMVKAAFASRAIRIAMVCSFVLWSLMLAWAFVHYFPPANAARSTSQLAAAASAATAVWKPVVVEWPNPLYRPRQLACAGGRVFSSDGIRLFELFPAGGAAVEVRCAALRGATIVDLSAACTGQGCGPVALVQHEAGNASTQVNDCVAGGSGATPVTLASGKAQHIGAVVRSRSSQQATSLLDVKLILDVDGDLVQFAWSAAEAAWRPEWLLGHFDAGALEAVSSSGGDLLLFHGVEGASQPAVEVRSVDSLQTRSKWRGPQAHGPLAAGCATGPSSALVLTYGPRQDDAPMLLSATLA